MFFTAIHQMMTEGVDLTLVIRKANGQLTVSLLPKSNGLKDEAQNHLVPLTVSGHPQELDAGFLQAVVSLKHWKQQGCSRQEVRSCCDLLSF